MVLVAENNGGESTLLKGELSLQKRKVEQVIGVEMCNKELLRSFSNAPHTHSTSLPLLRHLLQSQQSRFKFTDRTSHNGPRLHLRASSHRPPCFRCLYPAAAAAAMCPSQEGRRIPAIPPASHSSRGSASPAKKEDPADDVQGIPPSWLA